MGEAENIAPQWRAFYSDGKCVDSTQCAPPVLPPYDVQVIVQKDDSVGLQFVTGDFYLFVNNCWIGVDLFGLIDHLAAMGLIKVGRFLPQKEWNKIKAQAMAHYDAAMKSGTLPSERA